MSGAFRAYAATVTLAGAATLAVLGVNGAETLVDWRMLVLGGIVLVGELLPIDVPRREGLDRVTTSSAFALAALLLVGPFAAAVALAAASIVADASARLPLLKAGFNAAQYVLSVGAAAGVLVLAGADLPIGSLREELVAVVAGCAAFLAVNHVAAGVAAALLSREPIVRYLLGDLPFQLLTAMCVLALTPVVVASAQVSMVIVPVCLLPLLAIYIGARQAARDAHRAVHDALTELPNRALLNERLGRALRHPTDPLVLMIIDLDDFKAVNDTLGHAVGDRLLLGVADRLTHRVRAADTVARLGGDEFAVVVESADTEE
jgi:hypothetical protein